jgi:hypothetical protein
LNCLHCSNILDIDSFIKGKQGNYCNNLCSKRYRTKSSANINRECKQCQKPIQDDARNDKVFCNKNCKALFHTSSSKDLAESMLKDLVITNDVGTRIILVEEKEVIVDANLYTWLSKYNWYINTKGYACYRGMALHYLLKTLYGFQDSICDHVDRNKLNNTNGNLRPCTVAQNNRNKIYKNTSGYKGVHKSKDKWQAMIWYNGKNHGLGSFNTAKEAAIAYNKKAIEIDKEFSALNDIV